MNGRYLREPTGRCRRLRRSDRIARDADEPVLLPEEIEGLNRLFREANGTRGGDWWSARLESIPVWFDIERVVTRPCLLHNPSDAMRPVEAPHAFEGGTK